MAAVCPIGVKSAHRVLAILGTTYMVVVSCDRPESSRETSSTILRRLRPWDLETSPLHSAASSRITCLCSCSKTHYSTTCTLSPWLGCQLPLTPGPTLETAVISHVLPLSTPCFLSRTLFSREQLNQTTPLQFSRLSPITRGSLLTLRTAPSLSR